MTDNQRPGDQPLNPAQFQRSITPFCLGIILFAFPRPERRKTIQWQKSKQNDSKQNNYCTPKAWMFHNLLGNSPFCLGCLPLNRFSGFADRQNDCAQTERLPL